jgi:hypothetical protein
MGLRQLVPTSLQPTVRRVYRHLGSATSPLRMDPDFIVIGGQRCGTTTIFKTLAEHPQVWRPPVDKGTEYFSLHYDRGPSWYRAHFPTRAMAFLRSRGFGAPVAFEATTYYMFHPLALERIAQDLPDIKLVAILRDPVERAFSAHKHEVARGFDTEADFLRALELEDQRLDGEVERILRDPTYESFAHCHYAYRRRGEFAEQLERAYKLFSEQQIHVMESERFFASPHQELEKLFAFLELDPWTPLNVKQYNARPGSSMTESARAFLAEEYRDQDERLAELIGRRPQWAGHH